MEGLPVVEVVGLEVPPEGTVTEVVLVEALAWEDSLVVLEEVVAVKEEVGVVVAVDKGEIQGRDVAMVNAVVSEQAEAWAVSLTVAKAVSTLRPRQFLPNSSIWRYKDKHHPYHFQVPVQTQKANKWCRDEN